MSSPLITNDLPFDSFSTQLLSSLNPHQTLKFRALFPEYNHSRLNARLITKNENRLNGNVNYHSMVLYGLFFSHPLLLPSHLGFPCPFTYMPKEILAKKMFNLGSPRFEPITIPMPNQCTTIQPIHVL